MLVRPRPARPGKGGLCQALAAEAAAEVEHLAAVAARSLGAGGGLEAVELAIRTAVTRLGAGLLEDLLGLDSGYRGPRADCGAGHQAEFVSYRGKTIDTVLGPVSPRRAWYHRAACGHGLAPRDAELGTGRGSMSPGLAKMTAQAATAVPFAKAARLLAGLAGIDLTVKRVERSAEAAGKADDGQARTREVKLACLFTQTRVDDDGYPVRDPGSSSYLATFDPAARFGQLVDA
jgi:hypothetical protein